MWAKSMDSIRMVVKAVNQVKDLDKDEDAFSSFLETGSLPLKKLRSAVLNHDPRLYLSVFACSHKVACVLCSS